ncbi:MAG: hypothetical protein QM820_37050 [Minicystis sp.]
MDVVDRAGVREAEVAFAAGAEARARDRRDAQLVEPAVLELARREAGRRDVGEGIERAPPGMAQRTPGRRFSASTMASRRWAKTVTMRETESWGPSSAAMPACWTAVLTHE